MLLVMFKKKPQRPHGERSSKDREEKQEEEGQGKAVWESGVCGSSPQHSSQDLLLLRVAVTGRTPASRGIRGPPSGDFLFPFVYVFLPAAKSSEYFLHCTFAPKSITHNFVVPS